MQKNCRRCRKILSPKEQEKGSLCEMCKGIVYSCLKCGRGLNYNERESRQGICSDCQRKEK